MNPIVVKFYLQPILRVDWLILIFLFDLLQNSRHIDTGTKLDLVLGYKIIGVFGPEGFDAPFKMGQGAEKKSDADERVTSIVQIGYDDTPIALSTDHRIDRLHGIDHIDLSHRRRIIRAAMADRDLLKRLRAAHIADGIARTLA